MKAIQVSLSLLLITTLALAAAKSASAETKVVIEQSQGNSVSITTHCSGTDCNSRVETSVSQGQQQQFNSNTSSITNFDSNRMPMSTGHWRSQVPSMVWGWPMWRRGSGQIRINWTLDGGTCHVRYSEAAAEGYNYHTSAPCDDNGTTIGGLTSGQRYKFQVRKDDGEWSRVIWLRAR